jgi:hypothetical protein
VLLPYPQVCHEPKFAVVQPLDIAVELDRQDKLRPRHLPGVAKGEPLVRHLLLEALADALLEDAVFVTKAIAIGGQGKGGHGVQEARSQAPEAAVTKTGVNLTGDSVGSRTKRGTAQKEL